jgi:hypothetical protein
MAISENGQPNQEHQQINSTGRGKAGAAASSRAAAGPGMIAANRGTWFESAMSYSPAAQP